MNNEMLTGQWKQLKGKVKQQWGKLTDDEIDQIEGSWERLLGTIEKRYGIERAEAEKQVNEFLERAETEMATA